MGATSHRHSSGAEGSWDPLSRLGGGSPGIAIANHVAYTKAWKLSVKGQLVRVSHLGPYGLFCSCSSLPLRAAWNSMQISGRGYVPIILCLENQMVAWIWPMNHGLTLV